jgi:ATP-dependent DNA helicase RecG
VSINLIESQATEFKQIWKDEYLKTICAFANSDGGVLYIGVDDNSKVIGLDDGKKLVEILPNKINNRVGLIVDVLLNQESCSEYIEINVKKSYAPVSYSGKFYQRSGSNTIELNGSNLTNFLIKKYGRTWDDVVEYRFVIEDISLDTVQRFKHLAKDRVPDIQNEADLEQFLRKLNLYDGEYLKRAAVLLFAKDPQKYYIQSHSKIGRFLNETDIQSSDIINGNLIEQVDKIMDILRLKYLKAYISYEGVHRREKLEYPYESLREAVINALIHRDYTNTSNLQIRVYDDKLVIYNGATLSNEVPIDKFDKPHQSKPYNPIMASVFYKCGFIESWGRGTTSIINQCIEYGLPKPKFEYEWTAVVITFYKTTQETTQETKKISTKDRIIIELQSNSKLTREDLAIVIGVSADAIKQQIANLKEEGRLQRIGGTKSGYWQVVEV